MSQRKRKGLKGQGQRVFCPKHPPLRRDYVVAICDCFAEAVRRVRLARHLSKYRVAQQTHLSQSTIADLEKPRANPRLDTLERVGWALGMDGLALHALAKRLAQQRQRACSTLP